jgi:hypothetical protein
MAIQKNRISISMKIILALTALLLLFSCSENDPANTTEKSVGTTTGKPVVSLTRDSVKTAPVASYSVRTDNPLNEWYFKVQLFETPQTFKYLVKLQFEEIQGEDTLTLPNLGKMPEPVIQKGPDKYSCILAFKDQDGQVREYKKVYVKKNSLKITALKHYAVTTK